MARAILHADVPVGPRSRRRKIRQAVAERPMWPAQRSRQGDREAPTRGTRFETRSIRSPTTRARAQKVPDGRRVWASWDAPNDLRRSDLRDEVTIIGDGGDRRLTFLDKKRCGWSRLVGGVVDRGNQDRIASVQRSSRHYFQRPDAGHIDVDPNARR